MCSSMAIVLPTDSDFLLFNWSAECYLLSCCPLLAGGLLWPIQLLLNILVLLYCCLYIFCIFIGTVSCSKFLISSSPVACLHSSWCFSYLLCALWVQFADVEVLASMWHVCTLSDVPLTCCVLDESNLLMWKFSHSCGMFVCLMDAICWCKSFSIPVACFHSFWCLLPVVCFMSAICWCESFSIPVACLHSFWCFSYLLCPWWVQIADVKAIIRVLLPQPSK